MECIGAAGLTCEVSARLLFLSKSVYAAIIITVLSFLDECFPCVCCETIAHFAKCLVSHPILQCITLAAMATGKIDVEERFSTTGPRFTAAGRLWRFLFLLRIVALRNWSLDSIVLCQFRADAISWRQENVENEEKCSWLTMAVLVVGKLAALGEAEGRAVFFLSVALTFYASSTIDE